MDVMNETRARLEAVSLVRQRHAVLIVEPVCYFFPVLHSQQRLEHCCFEEFVQKALFYERDHIIFVLWEVQFALVHLKFHS